MIAVLVVLGGIAGGGYWLYTQNSDSDESTTASGSSDDSSEVSNDDQPTPTPTPTELFTDDGYTAEVGQCFTDSTTGSVPNLVLAPSCSPGSYEVVQRIPGTTDEERCGGDKNHSNYTAYYDDPSDDAKDLVLCMSFQYSEPAGSAIVGECVYSSGSGWDMSKCEPGAFEVIAKYYGTQSYGKCEKHDEYRTGLAYTNASEADLDVVLCTKFIYNDDAAYAKKNNCMKLKRENGNFWLYFSDCAHANAIVTGYTSKYQPSFCGEHGWVGYKQPNRDWKHLDYTVCWQEYP